MQPGHTAFRNKAVYEDKGGVSMVNGRPRARGLVWTKQFPVLDFQNRLSHEMGAEHACELSRTRVKSSDSDVSDWALTPSPNNRTHNSKKMDGRSAQSTPLWF
jgi:hypothetical protein